MEVHPEVLWKVPKVNNGLHQCGQIMNRVLLHQMKAACTRALVMQTAGEERFLSGAGILVLDSALPKVCPV